MIKTSRIHRKNSNRFKGEKSDAKTLEISLRGGRAERSNPSGFGRFPGRIEALASGNPTKRKVGNDCRRLEREMEEERQVPFYLGE